MTVVVQRCRLCGSPELTLVYTGPIRVGGTDSGQIDGFSVFGCANCGIEFLDPFPSDTKAYYSSQKYWEDHHGPVDIPKLQAKLGPEQQRWFEEIGPANLRGKRLADFGCGMGLFLDFCKQVAKETIGVDPAGHFEKHVVSQGHRFVQNSADLKSDSVDVVVSFDTLEHVPETKPFLTEIHRVLSNGGLVYLGVPNQGDFLKRLVPDYLPFFYHYSHLYYFSPPALQYALRECGFINVQISFVHKYDLMNMIVWARDKKGIGTKGSEIFDRFSEESFRNNLERQGIASHILVKAIKACPNS